MDTSVPPRRNHEANNDNNGDRENNHHRVRFAEEEPQPANKAYQPTTVREARVKLPSVFWEEEDRDTNSNLAQYTFYREGTPPPREYESRGRGFGHGPSPAPVAESSAAGGGTVGSDRDLSLGPVNRNEVSNWSLAGGSEMPPAAKKRFFWAIVTTSVLIFIAIAVAVGIGLGVSLSRKSAADPVGDSSSSSASTSVASSGGPTQTKPPADPTSSGTTNAGSRPAYNSDCPALNNTIYHVPGSTRSFLRLCGIDYGDGGATDLAQVYTTSMASCMDSCASFNQCTACSWGYLPGDTGSEHRCYMKTGLKKGNTAPSDWCFAILQ